MEALYAFMLMLAEEQPLLTFLVGWLAFLLAAMVKTLIIRTYRVLIIAIRGWPPAHLDADGDWRTAPKVETTTETAAIGDMTSTTIRANTEQRS